MLMRVQGMRTRSDEAEEKEMPRTLSSPSDLGDVSHAPAQLPTLPEYQLMTEEDREAAHHDHILRSFNAYRYQHLSGNNLRRQALAALPAAQQALLPDQSALLTVRLFYNTDFLPV